MTAAMIFHLCVEFGFIKVGVCLCQGYVLAQCTGYLVVLAAVSITYADPEAGEQGVRTPPPLKKLKAVGFLSNTGDDLLQNQKATKLEFNTRVGCFTTRERLCSVLFKPNLQI